MPSFIVVSKPCRIGETVPALHYDPAATGWPDKKSATPIKIRLAPDERSLFVDDEQQPRSIVSTVGRNNETEYLVTGSSKSLRNAERRRQLERASALLQQAGKALMALRADSDEPETVTAALAELRIWLNRERKRATAATHDVTALIG